jgi:hypothetical protein
MKSSSTHDDDDADNDNNATSIESNNSIDKSCTVDIVEQRCPVVVNRLVTATSVADGSLNNENHKNNNNLVRAEEK